jgi:hypothetical protein
VDNLMSNWAYMVMASLGVRPVNRIYSPSGPDPMMRQRLVSSRRGDDGARTSECGGAGCLDRPVA